MAASCFEKSEASGFCPGIFRVHQADGGRKPFRFCFAAGDYSYGPSSANPSWDVVDGADTRRVHGPDAVQPGDTAVPCPQIRVGAATWRPHHPDRLEEAHQALAESQLGRSSHNYIGHTYIGHNYVGHEYRP